MAFQYDISAKPTLYNGRLYRSRLEARWAAFFDLLGWKYEYEPFDLNGWSPDFLIKGFFSDILVEVKPINEFNEEVANKITACSPKKVELLLLGNEPLFTAEWYPCIGWLFESYDENGWGGQGWAESFWTHTFPTNQYGFGHTLGSYDCRITGNEKKYLTHAYKPDQYFINQLKAFWAEAANRAMFLKPKVKK